jgi:diacylglycerol kinase (ATP)
MSAALVIANPASRGGATRTALPELEARLRAAGLDFDLAVTERPGDATALARDAARGGRYLVVAAGGDGTLNEVANGLLEAGLALPVPSLLGVVPAGTGGDFRRTLGIPVDLGAAARVLAAARTRVIDAGRVRCSLPGGGDVVRHFVNVADAGIGGDVVDRVNRGGRLRRGEVSFLLAALATLMRWRNKLMRIEIDGAAQELVAQQVVVANGQYFGGGMRVAPGALPDDGQLDVVVMGDLGRMESARGLGKIRRGAHLTEPHPKVSHRRARQVRVSSPETVRVDVDGEQPGLLPAVFDVLPGALRVVVP